MEEIKNKIVFISPIDWGLGHASRCVPIIEELSKNNQIILGITGLNENYFNFYFPTLRKVKVPSYGIRYSGFWPAYLKVLFQWPSILSVIKKEREFILSFFQSNKIDVIVSDNRFGLHHPKIKSYFISHQLNLQVPFFSFLANQFNRRYIHRFEEVWVPDYEEKKARLSGKLSDLSGILIPVKYIGPKSALKKTSAHSLPEKKTDILVLLSGTEPQRSILEKQLIATLKESSKKIVLIRGTPSELKLTTSNITFYNEVYGEKLSELILNSEIIVCRSGYSTLMDLHHLGKTNLILIPTPGQTEQEYLANYWVEKFGARICQQKDVKLKLEI